MSGPIRRVTIRGFRGVGPELPVQLDSRSLLLRGDNGSGKSSIGDALRWALTGWEGPGGDARCLRHRTLPAGETPRVVVELTAGGRVERSDGDAACDDRGRRFRDACIRANPFFRREDLQDLLTQTSTDRFVYLKSFLDLHQVDASIESLAARRKAVQVQREQKERQVRASLDAAADRLGIRLVRGTAAELLQSARVRARETGVATDDGAGWPQLLQQCGDAARRAGSPEAARRKREVADAMDTLGTLVPPDHPGPKLEALRVARASFEGVDVSDLLQRALVHVREHTSSSECPVCGQRIDPSTLEADLEARLASLDGVRTALAESDALARAWRTFLDALEDLECIAASAGGGADAPRLDALSLLHELQRRDERLTPWIIGRLQALRARLTDELAALGEVDRAPALARLAEGLEAAASIIPAAELARSEADRLQRLDDDLGEVVKALTGARKTVFEQQCASVSSVFAQYYERIHPPHEPSEVTGAPQLAVTNRAKGTAVFNGIFNGENVGDPRWFYSDGHLDTVAICLFLALRRIRADRDREGDPRFMVLDDVILSIDSGHAGRLVRLIADEFDDHQVLVLSHNEYFMRLCRAPLGQARRLNIISWSLQGGPVLGPAIDNTARLLRTLGEASTADQVARDMSAVLDELVAKACDAFNVPLPRHDCTLSDQWNGLRKRLKDDGRQLGLGDVRPLLERLENAQVFRNVLAAHHNEWALEGISSGEVRAVAHAVLELVEVLQCTGCTGLVRPRSHHDAAAGLACDCGKSARPTLRRQISAAQNVEGA